MRFPGRSAGLAPGPSPATSPGPSPGLLLGLAALWLAGRAWLVWLLKGPQSWVGGDVAYFYESLLLMPGNGPAATLVEYPLPAVGVLWVPWLLAGLLGDPLQYSNVVTAMAVLTDLAFAVALWVHARHRSGSILPLTVWVLAVPLLGSTAYARFDLLPGVLCGLVVLVLGRHPGLAGALLAVATAVKLWPVLLVPAMLGVTRDRGRVLLGVVVAGGGLAVASLAVAGWDRLVSPLTYQVERGLQIESVLATPVMVGWALAPGTWFVGYADSKSFEVEGPAVGVLLALGTLLTVLYVAALLLAWWRLARIEWHHVDIDLTTTVWLVLATVSGFMVVGKVLSPQYLLWLLPVAAAGLAVADTRWLRGWTAVLLVATGLTQLVFPVGYGVVSAGEGEPIGFVTALAARNLLVLVLFGVAAGSAWRGLRLVQRGAALDRQPPGAGNTAGRTAR